MTERVEQRYCIKFCQKLEDSQAKTICKIHRVFGDSAISVTQIKVWYNRFKDGCTSVESNERSGRHLTCRNDVIIEEVKTLIMANCHLTVREIADKLGISKDSAHANLTQELGMHRVSAKFVPRLISEEQKQVCLGIAQNLLQTTDDNPECLNTVTTGDESWVY